MEGLTIYQKLNKIQNEVSVPKTLKNDFGNYNYRSAEMIQEAVKPLCMKYGVTLTISDELNMIGERYYIKATARLTDETGEITVDSFAREPLALKGQSEAQITGGTSSYARKYALNGMFQLDDNREPDMMDNREKPEPISKPQAAPNGAIKRTEKLTPPSVAADGNTDIVAAIHRKLHQLSDGEKKLKSMFDYYKTNSLGTLEMPMLIKISARLDQQIAEAK